MSDFVFGKYRLKFPSNIQVYVHVQLGGQYNWNSDYEIMATHRGTVILKLF